MALHSLKKCSTTYCKRLTRGARCDECEAEYKAPRDDRPTATERGYDKRWSKLALLYRDKHPLCETCKAFGRTRASECVDHIIPQRVAPDLFYVEANWQSLCWSCHSSKTNNESTLQPWAVLPNRYVITGKPGTGKTTWVAENMDDNSIHWDFDEECRCLGWSRPLESWQFDELRNRRDKLVDDVFRMRDTERKVFIIVAYPGTAARIAQTIGARIKLCHCDERLRRQRLASRRAKSRQGGV